MKRLILLTTMMAFMAGLPIAALANNDGFTNPSQWCTANNDWGYSSHGKCVSIFAACNSHGNTGLVCVCKDALDNDPETFYEEYNNLGDCINVLRYGYAVE